MAYKLSRELSCTTTWKNRDDLLDNLIVHPLFCEFYRFLGINFNDPHLLAQAMCHSSFAYQFRREGIENNEKLEFLGDSELGSYITSRLYEKFPSMNEGELSRFRAALISEDSLHEVGKFLNLGNLILIGNNLAGQNVTPSGGLVSSTLEAIVGAIILDQGTEKGRLLLDELFYRLKFQFGFYFWDIKILERFDVKTRLQEETVRHFQEAPEYVATRIDHQTIEVTLKFRNQVVLTTRDISKKKAERRLAKKVLAGKLYLMHVPLDDLVAKELLPSLTTAAVAS